MNKKRIKDILLIVLLLIVCGIVTVGLPLGAFFLLDKIDDVKIEEKSGKTIINDGDLEAVITDGYYVEEDKSYYVEGILKNNTNKDYEYIQLTFYVYDSENNILGEVVCNLQILEGNGSWRFKAEYCEPRRASEVANYKIINVEFY